MKDEVEKLINLYTAYTECEEWHIHDGSADDSNPNDGHRDFNEDKFLAALLALLAKAQVEAVRAELETALSQVRTGIHEGYNIPKFDCLDAEYITDRLATLKEDGETK